MEALFIKLLNMSITAGWLISAILLLRLLLKRVPKAFICALWGLVGLRLILPFSVESIFSLIPSAETVPQEILYAKEPAIHSGFPALNSVLNPMIGESLAPTVGNSVNPMQVIATIFAVIWCIGMVVLASYALISYLRLRRKTQVKMEFEPRVYLCDGIDTPFILGLFRPRIYLPSSINEADIPMVLAHEHAHLKRKDHWWKPLGFTLLTVYWFHPLLWVGYILLCRDIELACDERVLRNIGAENKRYYAEALLHCSVPRSSLAACPLAFGEVGAKKRIKSVLSYKKPTLWILIAAILIGTILAVCFLTDPQTNETVSTVGGVDPPNQVLIEQSLTLEQVVTLAEKGEALSWDDFDGFSYIETGSGLYIRSYDIDERFYLSIGGFASSEKPIYFYLHARTMEEPMIEIRYDDVQEFIEKYQDQPIFENLSAGWHTCPIGALEELHATLRSMNESKDNFTVSSIQYLPFIRIETQEELNDFLTKTQGMMRMDDTYSDTQALSAVLPEYDADFFKRNDLFLTYCTEPMTSIRHTVEDIKKSEGALTVSLQTIDPEEGDTAFEGWLICIRIAKDDLKDVQTVSFRKGSTYYPRRDTETATVSAKYHHEGTQLVLFDNGRFTYTSSPYSSYLGMGYYDTEESRIVLRFDDSDAAMECIKQGENLLIDDQLLEKEG